MQSLMRSKQDRLSLIKPIREEPDRMEEATTNIMENASELTQCTKAALEHWNNKVSLSFGNKMVLGHEILEGIFQNQHGVKSDQMTERTSANSS